MQRLQRYSSSELSHFVGRSEESDDARYNLLLRIIRSGELLPPALLDAHGAEATDCEEGSLAPKRTYRLSAVMNRNLEASLTSNERYLPSVVCFCDIPTDDLYIHTTKYGRFGLAFSKAFLARHGASPVFYVPRQAVAPNAMGRARTRAAVFDSEEMQSEVLTEAVSVKRRNAQPGQVLVARRSKRGDIEFWWSLHRHFLAFEVFAFTKFFDLDVGDEDPNNFYLEREWRVVGRVPFAISDIHTVFIPREYAVRWRRDVPEFAGQILFL